MRYVIFQNISNVQYNPLGHSKKILSFYKYFKKISFFIAPMNFKLHIQSHWKL